MPDFHDSTPTFPQVGDVAGVERAAALEGIYADRVQVVSAIAAASSPLQLAWVASLVPFSSGTAQSVTIPVEATLAAPVGFAVKVMQLGVGVLTVQAAGAVSLNGILGGGVSLASPYDTGLLTKIGADTWLWEGPGVVA